MDGLAQDLRDALRSFVAHPGFTAVVVATLALGIGANTAIFTLFDQILLRRLPVERPEELVMLDGPGPFQGRTENDRTFSHPMYLDFLEENHGAFAGVLARFATRMTLSHAGTAERVEGELVSGNYFEVLGVEPAIGRPLTPDDDRTPGAHPVAVLSHAFWSRRFAADPAILDQTIHLNGHPITVVGIGPPGFFGLALADPADVFVPMRMKAAMTPTFDDLDNRRSRWLNVFARLAPGVSPEAAKERLQPRYRAINEMEVATTLQTTSERFREGFLAKRLELHPGTQGMPQLRDESEMPLKVLMGMVGLVLLIACANVANLLLVRGQSRQREVALRLALGAGRWRVVRQRLLESLLYAFAGAALGWLLAAWGGELLGRALPAEGTQTISTVPDLRVAAFTAVVAVLTAILFGLIPAVQATRPALNQTLREGSGAVAGGRRAARFRRVLVAAQVALSVVLLAAAAVFGRSLFNLQGIDPGFPVEQLTTFSLDPSMSGYDTPRSRALLERVREEVAALPGVRAATFGAQPLLSGSVWSSTVAVAGYEADEGEDMNPQVDAVAPGYFATIGVPLLVGREFSAADELGSPQVAIVNQTMARYFFGEESPLGRRFGFGGSQGDDIEIVGVVADAREVRLREEPARKLWMPYRQFDDELGGMTFYVRHPTDAGDVAASARAAMRRIDPAIPLYQVRSMRAQVAESLMLDRMVALLSTLFGALATVLAAVGLYGVMSYSVVRRTREIGIRMALGAVRPAILRGILVEVGLLAGVGVAIGLPAFLGVGKLLESQLYGLAPSDPATLAGATALLAGVALFAGWLPARRATRVDPLRALRFE